MDLTRFISCCRKCLYQTTPSNINIYLNEVSISGGISNFMVSIQTKKKNEFELP